MDNQQYNQNQAYPAGAPQEVPQQQWGHQPQPDGQQQQWGQPPPPADGQQQQPPPAYNVGYQNPAMAPSQYTPPPSGWAEQGDGNPTSGADHPDTTQEPIDTVLEVDFSTFDDKNVRRGFIRKVFGILAIQLLITIAISFSIRFIPEVRAYTLEHDWVYIASSVLSFATLLVLVCVKNVLRKWPINFIALMIFTFFISVMLGSLMVYFTADSIGIAFGTAFVVTFVMFIIGFQSKFDLTAKFSGMCMLSTCLLMFGLFALIFQSHWATMAYGLLGAVLFSLWLLVDIQMVVGGSHKVQISPEEYIFAALNIYMDIINIVIFLLMILGKRG